MKIEESVPKITPRIIEAANGDEEKVNAGLDELKTKIVNIAGRVMRITLN